MGAKAAKQDQGVPMNHGFAELAQRTLPPRGVAHVGVDHPVVDQQTPLGGIGDHEELLLAGDHEALLLLGLARKLGPRLRLFRGGEGERVGLQPALTVHGDDGDDLGEVTQASGDVLELRWGHIPGVYAATRVVKGVVG